MSEEKVARFFNDACGLPYLSSGGRANILLYSIFKTLPEESEVIFPAIMCPSPLLVAEYAGLKPILANVNSSGLINPESVLEILKSRKNVSAIVSVNLYGQRPDNRLLSEMCRTHNVLLIEDAAQWWSYSNLGKDVDISVLSFGSKKIFDCGGGGLSLTRDKNLHMRVNEQKNLIAFSDINRIKRISAFYSKLYYLLADGEKITQGTLKNFIHFKDQFKELYFPSHEQFMSVEIFNKLQHSRNEYLSRAMWAQQYEIYFKKNPMFKVFMTIDPEAGPWRYSVLYCGKNREDFLGYLRSKEIDVSSWYPSLSNLGFNGIHVDISNSRFFGDKIINFWVEGLDQKKFDHTLSVIDGYKESL